METLNGILEFNKKFVADKEYEKIDTVTKIPKKEVVIVSCMDTRLTELLIKAMNIKNGDAKIIKVAGAVISTQFGSVMRSIVVAVHELGADEVIIVGHEDCGMATIDPKEIIEKMKKGGIPAERINLLQNAGIHLEEWLTAFPSVKESVKSSVNVVRNHPLIPNFVKVSGLIIHPTNGQLELVIDARKVE